MFRLTQILRNLFIRVEASVSNIFRIFFSFLSQFFRLSGKLLGFSTSEYFLESNEPKGSKAVEAQDVTRTESVKIPEVSSTTRRSNSKIDSYFLNMAKQVKKS
jgi:hypothetical protein